MTDISAAKKRIRNAGPPIGLILCGKKSCEQIELLQLDRGEIRMAEYLMELPPKEMLEAKLHE